MFLDTRALSAVGIKEDMPVTQNLHGVSLQGALLLTLGQLGLTCAGQEEFLVITTPDQAKYWGGALKPAKDDEDPSGKIVGHKRIRAALESPASMEFVDTPLEDVLAHLEDRHKVPIFLDRRSLRKAGIAATVPVTKDMKNVPLGAALRLVLDKYRLTLVVENGVLMITTQTSRKGSAAGKPSTGFRIWSDRTGKYKLEAKLVRVADGKVVLRKRDGSTVSVPLSRLSLKDRAWLKGK